MAQSDLRSRIVIEGADKATAELKTIGSTGEKAFSDVGKAADQSSGHVDGFTKATSRAASAMASFRSAASNAGAGFSNIGKRAGEFGQSLSNVATNIIPQWRSVLALGSVGGAAGFLKLFESTTQWAHDLEESSKQLGLTPGQLGLIGKAAKEAGLDMDHLVAGMTKFSIGMEKAADERRKTFGEIAKLALGADSPAGGGPTVFRGDKVGGQGGGQFISVRPLKEFREQAEEAWAALRGRGLLQNTPLDQFLSKVQQKLSAGGEGADKLVEELNKAGASLGVRTLGQQIDQALPGFKDLFAQLKVPLFDKATGAVRKTTDAFGDFLDAFAKKEPGEQARIVTETMGRGFLDLIPIMQKGRAGLLKFFDAAREKGADTSAFDKEIQALDEAFKATNRLNSAITGVRKALVLPFGDVFTPMINQVQETISANSGKIKEFAAGVAADLKVIALDLKNVFQGAKPQTDFGRLVVDALNAINVAISTTQTAFGYLVQAIQPLADILNSVFGVDYSARTYALAAAVLYFTGILPAMIAGVQAAAAAFAFFLTNPIGLTLTALALIGLTIYQNWSTIGPVIKQLYDDLIAFGAWIGSAFIQLWADGLGAVKQLWTGFTAWISGQVQQIKGWIDWIFSAISRAQSAASSAASAFGAAAGNAATAPGFAAGGPVPGSGNGDTVPAWLTPGEFVMRRSVVSELGAPFFAMLNRGMGSHLPRTRFATGGIVAAGAGGGTPVHLHLGGQSFALSGAENVVGALVHEAHRHRIKSTGTKPSWYGGTPGR